MPMGRRPRLTGNPSEWVSNLYLNALSHKPFVNHSQGARGRKDIALTEAQLQQLRHYIQQQREEYLQEMMLEGGATPQMLLRLGAKRDPLKGFMGVRGKRILERLVGMGLTGEDQSKRSDVIPAMGFVGMRGKKWFKPKSSTEEAENV